MANDLPDSVPHKHFFRASSELVMMEALPFLYDRYIKKAPYAYISWQTVGYNLHPSSWTWDDDPFFTNQLGHPFHGSIFYNSFRSNGYSFWESVPASFVGSYIWETYAENQYPAPNDFINTGFGGFMLGEATHRFAAKMFAKRRRSLPNRVGKIFAVVANPMYGFNRLISSKQDREVHEITDDTTRINAEFDMGVRKFNVNSSNVFGDRHTGMYGRVRLQYGSPFQQYREPFSNMSLLVEVGEDDTSKLNIISAHGSLAGWKIYTDKFQHVAILSADYDYIRNESFFFSAESIKMSVYSIFDLAHKITINTNIGAGPIILAAIPDSYRYIDRNYDYGPGLAFNGNARLSIADKISYSIGYNGRWMSCIDGHHSNYYLSSFTNEINVKLFNQFSVSAASGYFHLHGNYRDHPDTDNIYPYVRLSARYSTNF